MKEHGVVRVRRPEEAIGGLTALVRKILTTLDLSLD